MVVMEAMVPPVVGRVPAPVPVIRRTPRAVIVASPIIITPSVVISRAERPPGSTPAEREIERRPAPIPEHRGDVFGFHPYFVAHYHHVVKRRVVSLGVPSRVRKSQVIIARRHFIGRRLETPKPALVSTFVVGHEYFIVGICRLFVYNFHLVCFGSGYHGAQFGCTRLGFGLRGLGFQPLPLCDGYPVMRTVKVVPHSGGRGVRSSGTACRQHGGNRYCHHTYYLPLLFHIYKYYWSGYNIIIFKRK